MVHSCCVVGCLNRQNKVKGISLHRFPQKPFWRREAWIRAVSRLELDPATGQATKKTWVPNESSRICSVHFIDGKYPFILSIVMIVNYMYFYLEPQLNINP